MLQEGSIVEALAHEAAAAASGGHELLASLPL